MQQQVAKIVGNSSHKSKHSMRDRMSTCCHFIAHGCQLTLLSIASTTIGTTLSTALSHYQSKSIEVVCKIHSKIFSVWTMRAALFPQQNFSHSSEEATAKHVPLCIVQTTTNFQQNLRQFGIAAAEFVPMTGPVFCTGCREIHWINVASWRNAISECDTHCRREKTGTCAQKFEFGN